MSRAIDAEVTPAQLYEAIAAEFSDDGVPWSRQKGDLRRAYRTYACIINMWNMHVARAIGTREGGDADAAPGRSPESAVRRTRPDAPGASQSQQPAPAEPASVKHLVQLPDGTYTRKSRDEMAPDDMVVFDGPDAFASTEAAQARLEAEIEAAGGLEAWRKAGSKLYAAAAAVQPPVVPLHDELSLDPDGDVALDWASHEGLLSISISSTGKASFACRTGDSSAHGTFTLPALAYTVLRALVEDEVRGIGSVPPSANPDSVHQDRRSGGGVRTEGEASS